jgi:putative transposase
MATHMRTELIIDALRMAAEQRRPSGVIHHSDQGSQYTSIAFGLRCREWGVRPSMGSVGDCYDNAMAESFFATLECELLARTTLRNPREAELRVFQFIEGWYNPRRRHSSIEYLSPNNYERRHKERMKLAA